MFRNLRLYRLDTDWPESERTVSDRLGVAMCERVAAVQGYSGPDQMSVEARLEEFTERTGESPGAREKRRLKAEVKDELLPKAMLRSDRTWGYVDPKQGIIAIDSAQPAMAERFLRRLTVPFGSLKSRPLGFARSANEVLTKIFLGERVGSFSLGRECRMRDPASARSSVRWTDFDLTDPSIRHHVADGMQLTHLGVVYDEAMSCVIDEDGVVSKIRFLGMDDEPSEDDSALAKIDAEFVLLTGTIRHLLTDLQKALGGFA